MERVGDEDKAPETQDAEDRRPVVRADCEHGERPCPWVGCRYHMFLEVANRMVHMRRCHLHNLPEERIAEILEELPFTCLLDAVVDRQAATLEEVGKVFRLTRERIRQIEDRAMERVATRATALGYRDALLWRAETSTTRPCLDNSRAVSGRLARFAGLEGE